MKRLAMLAPLALLSLTACGDRAAEDKAKAEAKAKADEAGKARLVEEGIALNTRCYVAVKSQARLLDSPVPREFTGGSAPYLAYYRDMIVKKLGASVIPAAPPKPELSLANLDAYLGWAEKDEALAGAARVAFTGCVQGAADFGAGPMAKLSPAERLGQIQRLRAIMDATGG
ncbi:hypothetical protein [Sphingomonas sp. LT1P40]|uniref:hypothetical protein n=1 Tax=Alteristakelama amylovorans TaxID=3096166 RepID=UPI002FCB853D